MDSPLTPSPTKRPIMSKRIYLVTRKGSHHRLVRATTPAQAVRFAAGSDYQADVATQQNLVEWLGNGLKVEEAVDKPDEAAKE